MERRQSDKVVWVNGTFDVMHIGHIKLLEFAKSLGDTLVVGIDDDSRVSELKGPDRPVNSLKDRMEFMSALKVVIQHNFLQFQRQYYPKLLHSL